VYTVRPMSAAVREMWKDCIMSAIAGVKTEVPNVLAMRC
jgi:hypothetical protein